MERREMAKERERGILGSETFTVMVIGQSILERQAAVLSKSRGRRPVALQRAAQQCLSQHINNSSVSECVCIHKCVRTVPGCVCPVMRYYCGKTCGWFICVNMEFLLDMCALERVCSSG